MKILHLCLGNFFIDNYSYQENILPKYHAKQGHDVMVIASLFTFNNEGKGTFLSSPAHYHDNNGFEVVRLTYKKPISWNKFFRHYDGLKEVIEQFAPDVIFSHNVSYGDTLVVKNYIKRNPNTKLFADNHADYINSAKNWMSRNILHPIIWRHYAKIIEPYMTKCFGVTPMRCRFLKEMYHINSNIIEFLPMGVDDESIPENREEVRNNIRKQFNMSDDDILIFTGGKIDWLKNTHILIDAIKLLEEPRLHLVICGVLTPEMNYLKEKFNNNIHYLGWCDAKDVMNNMIASDFACFPGTHSTLWEQAVGVGLPCILKHWNEMTHMDINGNCIFIKGDDISELKDAISKMINKDFYLQQKEKASNVAQFFLYSDIAKKAIGLK